MALESLDETGARTTGDEVPVTVEVYYSDLPVAEGTPVGTDPWIRIMRVDEDGLTIWPVHQRAGTDEYGKPIFYSIKQLIIPRAYVDFDELPQTQEALENMLEGLPAGFYRD
ncbi:hypothetical protein [Stutzerimonas stutzeri]|uniref:hypothetical protein n=1 Tax=Stutzerimonas stutzeri TaxID=316 RepID=UPI001BCA7DA3|nr:hypothetical protein [Stutzerimonas stutzeri]